MGDIWGGISTEIVANSLKETSVLSKDVNYSFSQVVFYNKLVFIVYISVIKVVL